MIWASFDTKNLKKSTRLQTSRIDSKIHFDKVKTRKSWVGRQVMFILSKVIQ